MGGTATSTTVSNGGAAYVHSGGTTSYTTLQFGQEYVDSGGSAVSTTLSGGIEHVSGGTASFTTVEQQKPASTSSPPAARPAYTTLAQWRRRIACRAGGSATFTIVSSGGNQVVSSWRHGHLCHGQRRGFRGRLTRQRARPSV